MVRAKNLFVIEANENTNVRVIQGQVGAPSAKSIRLTAIGGSTITAAVSAGRMDVRADGAGMFVLTGKLSGNAALSFNGAMSYETKTLQTQTTDIQGFGSFTGTITMSQKIPGKIEGAASISYADNPQRLLVVDRFLQWTKVV